jgi:hypothetical protein
MDGAHVEMLSAHKMLFGKYEVKRPARHRWEDNIKNGYQVNRTGGYK